MSKLQYQCAMSLDGFIAGPNGDMSWLATASDTTEPEGAAETINPLVAQVGAVLSGHRTYRGDDPNAGTEKEATTGSTPARPSCSPTTYRKIPNPA